MYAYKCMHLYRSCACPRTSKPHTRAEVHDDVGVGIRALPSQYLIDHAYAYVHVRVRSHVIQSCSYTERTHVLAHVRVHVHGPGSVRVHRLSAHVRNTHLHVCAFMYMRMRMHAQSCAPADCSCERVLAYVPDYIRVCALVRVCRSAIENIGVVCSLFDRRGGLAVVGLFIVEGTGFGCELASSQ